MTRNPHRFIKVPLRAFFLLLCAASSLHAADVNVAKAPPKVTRHTFDPNKPPAQMPTLHGTERAITVYIFRVEIDVRYLPGMAQRLPDGTFLAAATVQGVSLRLEMPVTVWNPNDADDHLKAHEEGHVSIAMQFYQDADKAARAAAQPVIGRRIEGKGPNKIAAYRAAIEEVSRRISERYNETIMAPCKQVQDQYDDLTRHSANRAITSEKAVEQVMAAWRKSQPVKSGK